ncbi:MAG: hypothetical protein GY765_00290, partial [bacterium]|nr:hypothetical protein [bacterium]
SPNFLGYVKASYSFGTDITFALTGKYIGEMETLWDVGKLAPNNTGDLGARIGPKVDGYFTLDGNLRFNNLFKKGYFLNVRCSNLFNTAYLYPMYTNNTPWVDKGIFGHGRAFFISVGRKF